MDINSPDANLASAPQLRFGKIDGLFTRVSAAIAAARKLLFSTSTKRATGAANSKPTPPSSPITFSCIPCSAPATRTFPQSRKLDHPASESRWRMEYLRLRPLEHQRLRQGLLRIKARRILRRSSRPPARPQKNPRTRRRHRSQHLHKIYLCFFGQYDYDAVPAFRPRSFSFPTGSGSTSTRFPRGRAPFSSPFPSATPRSRSRKSRAKWASKNYSSAA